MYVFLPTDGFCRDFRHNKGIMFDNNLRLIENLFIFKRLHKQNKTVCVAFQTNISLKMF